MERIQPIPALLVRDNGRWPYVGHLRGRLETERAVVDYAGRIAAEAGLETAFEAARALDATLRAPPPPESPLTSRFDLLRHTWQVLLALEPIELGPAGGQDLSLLLVVRDIDGIGVAGTGLSMVWALLDQQPTPLVPPDHPLLTPPGRPGALPGVLSIEAPVDKVLACPAHLAPPDSGDLLARCGALD